MKPAGNQLSASQEDYLETIYHIITEKQVARAKEIASKLKVSRPSVTEAFRSLAQKELINYSPYEVITLTDKGKEAAEDVIRRHRALKNFFIKILAVGEGPAEEGACRIEHAAPPEIIERLTQFVDFLEQCPGGGSELITAFSRYCQTGRPDDRCRQCSSPCHREEPANTRQNSSGE